MNVPNIVDNGKGMTLNYENYAVSVFPEQTLYGVSVYYLYNFTTDIRTTTRTSSIIKFAVEKPKHFACNVDEMVNSVCKEISKAISMSKEFKDYVRILIIEIYNKYR